MRASQHANTEHTRSGDADAWVTSPSKRQRSTMPRQPASTIHDALGTAEGYQLVDGPLAADSC